MSKKKWWATLAVIAALVSFVIYLGDGGGTAHISKGDSFTMYVGGRGGWDEHFARARREVRLNANIIPNDGAKSELMFEGRVIFQGWHILHPDSITHAGVHVAVGAYNSDKKPLRNMDWMEIWEGRELQGSIGEVWYLNLDSGERKKISPAGIHAIRPLVSPDGQWVSFIGHEIIVPTEQTDGMVGEPVIYVVRVENLDLVRLQGLGENLDLIVPWAWQSDNDLVILGGKGETLKERYLWDVELALRN